MYISYKFDLAHLSLMTTYKERNPVHFKMTSKCVNILQKKKKNLSWECNMPEMIG